MCCYSNSVETLTHGTSSHSQTKLIDFGTYMRGRLLPSAFLVFCVAGIAQKGSAPSGYYPEGYRGDTYTGTVVGTGEHQITLEYTHKGKTESFTAVASHPCVAPLKAKPGAAKEMPLRAIPIGSQITVLYSNKKVKRPDGTTGEDHVMIGFAFSKLNGQTVTDPAMIPCFEGFARFMAF